MERREHYDPEDIENLLQERGFDELLEEERAFVLRHLSGRDEYEAMRSLLLQVREDDRRMEPLTLDPAIRENVIAAFRAQQRPQWQVWLNSVGTLLWPKEVSAMWRPALAFATLAVLIVVGVQVMRNGPDAVKQQQMAEVRPNPSAEEANAQSSDSLPSTGAMPESRDAGAPQAAEAKQLAALQEPNETPAQPIVKDGNEEVTFSNTEALADDASPTSVREDRKMEAQAESRLEREELSKAKKETVAVTPTTTGSVASHVVTVDELSSNMSTANASTRSKAYSFRAKNDAKTDLTDSPEIMALLTKGW